MSRLLQLNRLKYDTNAEYKNWVCNEIDKGHIFIDTQGYSFKLEHSSANILAISCHGLFFHIPAQAGIYALNIIRDRDSSCCIII